MGGGGCVNNSTVGSLERFREPGSVRDTKGFHGLEGLWGFFPCYLAMASPHCFWGVWG